MPPLWGRLSALVHSFLHAGARHVLVRLWRAEPEGPFLQLLYEHLSRGRALDVYEVWSVERGCLCVVKTLRPDHSGDRSALEDIRFVICLKQGHWPSREEDVEEVDVDKLKEMVEVEDAALKASAPALAAKPPR